MLVVTLGARYIGVRHHRHYVGAITAALASAAFVKLRAHFLRHTLNEVDAYQAHEFWQKARIISSLQAIKYITDGCDHIGDPEHQKCRAAGRKELAVIQAAIGRSPSPDIVRGNKPPAAVGAAGD